MHKRSQRDPTNDRRSRRSPPSRSAGLVRTPAVRALFEVLLAGSADPSAEVAAARDRFRAAHLDEAGGIVERAVARSELPAGTDPAALVDLVIGPALLRLVLMGQDLETVELSRIVDRAIAALRGPGSG
jgi:hypothetical protein